MHPTRAFIFWLCAVLAAQSLSYTGCALLAGLIFLSAPKSFADFLRFTKKGRWLLLALWFVFAYGKPGEAIFDLSWAPTQEGVAEANLHVARLLLMFACLAWLFARLAQRELLVALWSVLRPWRRLGCDVERLVVRLSLVLAYVQSGGAMKDWRQMLREEKSFAEMPSNLEISIPSWSFLDSLLVCSAMTCTLWIVL